MFRLFRFVSSGPGLNPMTTIHPICVFVKDLSEQGHSERRYEAASAVNLSGDTVPTLEKSTGADAVATRPRSLRKLAMMSEVDAAVQMLSLLSMMTPIRTIYN